MEVLLEKVKEDEKFFGNFLYFYMNGYFYFGYGFIIFKLEFVVVYYCLIGKKVFFFFVFYCIGMFIKVCVDKLV